MVADPRFARWYAALTPAVRAPVAALLGYVSASTPADPGRPASTPAVTTRGCGSSADRPGRATVRSSCGSCWRSTTTTLRCSWWAAMSDDMTPTPGDSGKTGRRWPPPTWPTRPLSGMSNGAVLRGPQRLPKQGRQRRSDFAQKCRGHINSPLGGPLPHTLKRPALVRRGPPQRSGRYMHRDWGPPGLEPRWALPGSGSGRGSRGRCGAKHLHLAPGRTTHQPMGGDARFPGLPEPPARRKNPSA